MIEDIRLIVNGPESVLIEPPFCLQRKGTELQWKTVEGDGLHLFGGNIWENRPLWEQGEDLTPLEVSRGFEEVEVSWGTDKQHFYQKQIKANDNSEVGLKNSDWIDDLVGLEIAARSAKNMNLNCGLLFCVAFPGDKFLKTEVLTRVCFGGPSGEEHSGYYALKLTGDGQAELLSRHLDQKWHSCGTFQYCSAGKVGQNVHRFYIRPFICDEVAIVSIQVLSGLEQVQQINFCHKLQEIQQFHVVLSKKIEWKKSEKICVEMSSFSRGIFRVSAVTYSEFTHVREGGFCLPFHPFTEEYFKIGGIWSSGVSFDLLDANKMPLRNENREKFFPLLSNRGHFSEWQIKGTKHSPGWLYNYWVQRDGFQCIEPNQPLIIERIKNIDLIGADQEIDHERGVIRFYDKGDLEERLFSKGRVSISIQIKKADHWVHIFRGFIDSGQTICLDTKEGWKLWECKVVGMWRQLKESFTPVRWVWKDKNIFEALTQLLSWAGFSSSMISLPTRDIFSKTIHFDFEPMVCISDIIEKLLREILGGGLVFDPSLGSMGAWRWVDENGQNTAVFFTSEKTIDSNLSNIVIRKRTHRSWTVPPIANHLIVSGIETKGESIRKISQVLINPHSFKVHPDQRLPLKENLDYLGRRISLHIFDPCLNDEGSINHVAKKIYQRTCLGKKIQSFTADLAWEQNRLVQTGDRIVIDNEDWKLKNINISLNRGRKAKAFYEFERI